MSMKVIFTSVSQRLWVQIPYRPEFFSALFSLLLISSVHYCEDGFHTQETVLE